MYMVFLNIDLEYRKNNNFKEETDSCPRNTFGGKIHFFRNQLKMQKNKYGMLQEPVLNMFSNLKC